MAESARSYSTRLARGARPVSVKITPSRAPSAQTTRDTSTPCRATSAATRRPIGPAGSRETHPTRRPSRANAMAMLDSAPPTNTSYASALSSDDPTGGDSRSIVSPRVTTSSSASAMHHALPSPLTAVHRTHYGGW